MRYMGLGRLFRGEKRSLGVLIRQSKLDRVKVVYFFWTGYRIYFKSVQIALECNTYNYVFIRQSNTDKVKSLSPRVSRYARKLSLPCHLLSQASKHILWLIA